MTMKHAQLFSTHGKGGGCGSDGGYSGDGWGDGDHGDGWGDGAWSNGSESCPNWEWALAVAEEEK